MKERLCERRYTVLSNVVGRSERRGDVSCYRRGDYDVTLVLFHKVGYEGANSMDNPVEKNPQSPLVVLVRECPGTAN